MKKIIAKKDFTIDDDTYLVGEEVVIDNIETIIKLNEKGFIEPLDFKELSILKRQFKNNDKEEEN